MKRKLTSVFYVLISFTMMFSCQKGVGIKAIQQNYLADDGEDIITYELISSSRNTPPENPRAVFFYIQGSSYESVIEKTGMLASSVIFGARGLMVEKRGCTMDTVDLKKAHYYSDKQTRVSDYLTVLDSTLEDINSEVPVILVGGSEGGDIAAAVAAQHKKVTHLILISTGGGMSQTEEFRYFVKNKPGYLNCNSLDELDSILSQIERSENSMEMWAGHPYKRWKSYLNDSSLIYLKTIDFPVLLVHGDADVSVPVQSARKLNKAIKELGKNNLTYIEYKDLDHALYNINDGKSRYPYLEIDIIDWLKEQSIVSTVETAIFKDRVKRNHKDIF